MRTFSLDEIRSLVRFDEILEPMREAVIAQSAGECDTPMPMHLAVAGEDAEVHVKSSYRRGGGFFALKAAGSFPRRAERGESTGNGMIVLFDAATGDPVAFFDDRGWLTDVRTAAVAAMAARALGRRDSVLGILGTGTQARHQALLHARVLPLSRILVWGRTPASVETCRRDLAELLPGVDVVAARSVSDVAANARLIVTATASRIPLLGTEVGPGTLVSAVGSDSPGKQELEPELVERCTLLLVDSIPQCERLGELQHARSEKGRAVELGTYCASRQVPAPDGIVVCDFTGLGVEDLAIAEYVFRKSARPR